MYIKRDQERELDRLARLFTVTVIVGPRQVGKTTLLKAFLGTSAQQTYLTFDDPDVLSLFDRDIKHFEKQFLRRGGLTGLDEVHYGRGAGRKLKYLADKGYRLVVTSSSEMILGSQVLSQLAGRVGILRLYPFSLAEFMRSAGLVEAAPEAIRRSIWEHAVYGGYPKVVLTGALEDKRTILKSLYETLLYKDVVQTFSISDLAALEKLVLYLARNIGTLLSYQAAAAGTGLSYPTLKKYLEALEKTGLVRLISPFSSNANKELVRQPKAYFIDCGLRNAVSGDFPATLDDQGRLFENYVFTELLKHAESVKFWRTKSKSEVDFVVKKAGRLIPIEAKLGRCGMTKGLASFIESHRPSEAMIVCEEGHGEKRQVGGCRVRTLGVEQLGPAIKAQTG